MDVELKTNTKISYICAYLKKKFPFYVNSMEQIDLMKLANKINIAPKIKNISFEELKSGSMDSFIDDLVDEYAREHLSDIWENFSNFCRYIEEVIIKKYKKNNCSAFLKDVSFKIALSTNSKIGFDTLMSGSYDEEYLKKFKNFNFIKSVVNETGLCKEAKEYIFNQIFNQMLEKYDSDEVYSVDFVKKSFMHYYRKLTDKIAKRVSKVISEIELIFGIPESAVKRDIVNMSTVTGEISAIKIINGQLDDFIRNYAESKRNKNYEYNDDYVLQHIFNVLRKEADEDIPSRELYEYSEEVLNILLSKGHTGKNIVDGYCDELIIKKYNDKYHPSVGFEIEKIRRHSVKDKKSKKPDLVKYNKIKRFIQREIAKFLIVTVLGTMFAFGAGNYINRREDEKAIEIVEAMAPSRGYSIDKPYYVNLNADVKLVDGVVSIIEYYDVLEACGEEYTVLCFYDAYKSGLSIFEMDELCNMLKRTINNDDQYRKLYDMVVDMDCFVDIMYDSLIRMGCEEIKDEKYLKALVAYKQSFHGNAYGIASDGYLHEEDKIWFDKMVEMYEEYSRKCQIELGNRMKNMNEENVTLSSGLGRGV